MTVGYSDGGLAAASRAPGRGRNTDASNDGTIRAEIWRRYEGDEWAAFDQLPVAIRRRLNEHAYEPWSVNSLMLWRHYRRLHAMPDRAERALLRYLDYCERLERRAFAEDYAQRHGAALAHEAAGASVLRYQPANGAL